MESTSVSLLERLRTNGQDRAWHDFVDLYTPLIQYWARQVAPIDADASDLIQDVFLILAREIPRFNYDRAGSFRGWLRTVTTNRWRELRRRKRLPRAETDGELDHLAIEDPAEEFWKRDYRALLVARALELMQTYFEGTTWRACWETVVMERSAIDVAEELCMSVGAVYAAKSRVLRRLRTELEGLWDG